MVLSEARRQGLSVSKGAENHYSKYRRELLGNYYPISKYDPNSDDGYTYLYFAIGWTITEPSTKETCEITLGLTVKEMDKKSLINKHTITYSYTPTTSAAEVENFIKNWLTSIFKHQ